MNRIINSALLFFSVFIYSEVLSQQTQDTTILFKNTLQQETNLHIQTFNLDLNGNLSTESLQQQYIRIELNLSNPSETYDTSNQEQLNSKMDCEVLNCHQDVFLAVIYSYNAQDFSTIYNTYDKTISPPLKQYSKQMDYSAFLRQKKTHLIIIPTSEIKKNKSQISIGIFNLASKVGLLKTSDQNNKVTFKYDLKVSQVVQRQDECLKSCQTNSGECDANAQTCICYQNYFDLDCSLEVNMFSNLIILSDNNQKPFTDSYYVSGDQIEIKQFKQQLQQIQPGQWIYYYWTIDSSLFPSLQQSNPKASPTDKLEYDVILSFQNKYFTNISLSYIFYGDNGVCIPNILSNYNKIETLQSLDNSLDNIISQAPKNDQTNIVQLKISYENLKNYVEMYRNLNLIDIYNKDTTILFGFKNEGSTVSPSDLSYTITIKYKKESIINPTTGKNNEVKTIQTNVEEGELQNSHIIIISCISVVFFVGVLIFLFRKRICPKRYQQSQSSELDKKSLSNISIAADSMSRKKIESSSHKLHSSGCKQSFQSNQLSSNKNQLISNIPLSQNYLTSNFQQQLLSSSKTVGLSQQSAHKFLIPPKDTKGVNSQNLDNSNINCTNIKINSLPFHSNCNCKIISNEKCNTPSHGQTIQNLQSSFQNLVGEKSFQPYSGSNPNIEDMLEEQFNKQQNLQALSQRRYGQEQNTARSLSNILGGNQTFNHFNQMTTQANSDRKSFQTDWNLLGIPQTLANLDSDCEACFNKRRISKTDSGSQKYKKSSIQPLEIPAEEDEVAAASHEDSLHQDQRNKKDHPISGSTTDTKVQEENNQIKQDFNQNEMQQQLSNKIENDVIQSQKQRNELNLRINTTPNNLLLEKYIIYGPSIIKEMNKKSQNKRVAAKTKQRINYQLNKKFKKRKIKKQVNRNEELDSDNVSICFHYKNRSSRNLSKVIKPRKNSINSSKFSLHMRDSNSSRLSGGKSIRKKQNTPRGVVSRFFQAQKRVNSTNTLRLKDQKPFSFDLDVSSIQRKIKLAESIFTGVNPSSNNLSLEFRELRSLPRTADALDSPEITDLKEQFAIKQNSNQTESPLNNLKNYINPPQVQSKKFNKSCNNNDEIQSETKSPLSICNYGNNNLVNTFLHKDNLTPNGKNFGSPQLQSFGIQNTNTVDQLKLQGENETPRMVALDQGSKGFLLPSYILNISKKSEDLSTPGFLQTRQQNGNSKPSVFFHQKCMNYSPQRSSSQEQNLPEEEKEIQLNSNNSNQKLNIHYKLQQLRQEDQVIQSFNYQNKTSFEQNSPGIKQQEKEFNTSNYDTTMVNNFSIEEGQNRNSIYKKSLNLKSIATPDKSLRVEDITIASTDNEQIQINKICYDNNQSGFNLRKIRSLNSYDYSQPFSQQKINSKYEINLNKEFQNYIKQQTFINDEEKQQQIPSSAAIFCQNGFLFTNLNSNKLNWENSRANPFTSSISEISNHNMTTFSNNIIENDEKQFQSTQHLD